MFRIARFAAAPLFVVLMGGAAHAALTADQVWQGWKDAGARVGLTVTAATEVKDAGVLTLNGVSLIPNDGKGGMTLSDMTLTEAADGSVVVTPATEFKVDFAQDIGTGTAILTQDALSVVVTEGAAGLDYGFAAKALTLAYETSFPEAPQAEGVDATTFVSTGTVTLTVLDGMASGAAGDNEALAIRLNAGTLGYDLGTDAPSAQLKSNQTSLTEDIAATINLVFPKTLALSALTGPEAFSAALQEGMALDIAMTQGVSRGTSKDENPFFPLDFAVETLPGTTTFSANAAGMILDATGAGATVDITTPMIPSGPAKVTMGPLQVGFTFPLLAGETAGDFRYLMNLTQVTLNEESWAAFDAGKALPRDPADLMLDIGGKMKIDILAMAAAEDGAGPVVPPEPQSLDIRALSLKVAGALLTGSGAFTFDNAPVAAGGAPIPAGNADISLTGGNALIDGLIKAGLLTEENAMGPRMMMGAFMSPGEGADTLTSKIEARADGQIFVNGQRVQ